jgi:hypothetical protein
VHIPQTKELEMTILTYGESQGPTSFIQSGMLGRWLGFIARAWRDYRVVRDLERVPNSVMKDIGYPAAERVHEA